MIQAEPGEDQMPYEDKAGEKRIVFDFKPHMEEFMKCDGVALEIHHGSSQHEHRDHDEQVEELECCK